MKTFEATTIWVTWGEKIKKNSNNEFEKLIESYSQKNCLYQAYGDSPIYGRDVLLYIGRTNNEIRRIKDHLKSDFSRINNLSVIIGEISENQIDPSHSEDYILKIVEPLLITMLKPSYNSVNIKDTGELLKEGKKYIILNCENRGALPLEVTNIWWDNQNS